MADLLLELFCEEIPARMQAKAESDLKKAVLEGLSAGGLGQGDTTVSMSGPRRLAVAVQGLATRSDDVVEERKGPKVGAPDKAVEGFMRGAGLSDISEAEVRSDPKKGDFYVATKTIPGRNASDIIADLVPEIVRGFHWPKSMRTGTGELRWVRPLQRIVCVFDGKTVPFEIDGLKSSNETEGHRVHGRGPFKVTGLEDYVSQLSQTGHVLLTRDERRTKIEAEAKAVCEKAGLELVEDKGLLEEVTGLAEWPYVILGDMDEAFLELPPEVIQLSMRTHQKYFSVRDLKTGKLAPHFVVVANIEATDGGKAIAAGNRKVLSARLDDGRFFWENDKKAGLEAMAPKLSTIKFKDELGSIADKVERVAALARELAPKVGADPELAERAAKLAKADLVSEMVYEFPELQGVMGRYYALEAGEDARVADAIRDHYKPQGPSDAVPTDPVGITVALADKLDTLVGFWAIDEKPTGSKDPFALRRAALGLIRILLEHDLALSLKHYFWVALTKYYSMFKMEFAFEACISKRHGNPNWKLYISALQSAYLRFFVNGCGCSAHAIQEYARWRDTGVGEDPLSAGDPDRLLDFFEFCMEKIGDYSESRDLIVPKPAAFNLAYNKAVLVETGAENWPVRAYDDLESDLLAFFADRLKQYLRDQGQRHDLIDAVFALGEDDLVLITKRVEALGAFLETEDGASLMAGYKRAANILKAEEKKDGAAFDSEVDESLLEAKAEKALFKAITKATKDAETALTAEDFSAAMSALASLREPVDAFFDGPDSVMVNADDAKVRANRLNLLNMMRSAIGTVADFSKIEG